MKINEGKCCLYVEKDGNEIEYPFDHNIDEMLAEDRASGIVSISESKEIKDKFLEIKKYSETLTWCEHCDKWVDTYQTTTLFEELSGPFANDKYYEVKKCAECDQVIED